MDFDEVLPPEDDDKTVRESSLYPLPPPPPPLPDAPTPPVAPSPPLPPVDNAFPAVDVIVYPGLKPLLINALCEINVPSVLRNCIVPILVQGDIP